VFNSCASESNEQSVDDRLNSLLSKMTLEEKIGQMNQYSSFWDITGPAPKEGSTAKQFEQLKNGLVGSMLNVQRSRKCSKITTNCR
jgi:beta-glucosidase